jgi:DNA-directed RNA polymerase subunit H (RpoH/RPB5)|tara:strand:- start:722 stop:982 length:261 start_codon:yes stop_codon:yes gene_type:complete
MAARKKIVLDIDISKHILVPKHTKLSDEEKKELTEKYNIALRQLPKILKSDAAIEKLAPETGDVIKITRKSHARGEIDYFRVVVNA